VTDCHTCVQVSGLETDLAGLWQAVESLGGLQQVIDKHRWNKVVEMLKIPKIVSQRVLTPFLNVNYLLSLFLSTPEDVTSYKTRL